MNLMPLACARLTACSPLLITDYVLHSVAPLQAKSLSGPSLHVPASFALPISTANQSIREN